MASRIPPRLEKDIIQFLSISNKPKHNNKPTKENLELLDKIFRQLTHNKFRGCNMDSSQINLIVVDRTRQRPLFYEPLPYTNENNIFEILRLAVINCKIANSDLEMAARAVEGFERVHAEGEEND